MQVEKFSGKMPFTFYKPGSLSTNFISFLFPRCVHYTLEVNKNTYLQVNESLPCGIFSQRKFSISCHSSRNPGRSLRLWNHVHLVSDCDLQLKYGDDFSGCDVNFLNNIRRSLAILFFFLSNIRKRFEIIQNM